MVMTYIPQWARDPNKEGFLRLPHGTKEVIASNIAVVRPRNLAIERPTFEDKIYGERTIDGKRFIVGREALVNIAVKVDRNKETLRKRGDMETQRIVDPVIRHGVEHFWEKFPTATLGEWKAWCENYRRSNDGPRVRNVLVTKSKADSTEEYRNIAKHGSTGRGQFKRGAKHRGYFIYERPAPTKKDATKTQLAVRPVFVFEGKKEVLAKLSQNSDWKIHGYFESGCQVKTARSWHFQGGTDDPDQFILGSVWANRNAKLWHTQHGEIGPVGLRILLDAGFERI